MKKKSIIVILLALVLCLGLVGCGGGNDASSYTEEEIYAGMVAPEIVDCCEYFEPHNVPYTGIWEFIDVIESDYPDNPFAVALAEKYDALGTNSMPDLEKDFMEIFPLLMVANWGDSDRNRQGFNIDEEYFGKAWVIGYDGDTASGELPHDARAIILETTGSKLYPNQKVYAYLIAFDDEYVIDYLYDDAHLKEVTGITPTSTEGTCINTAASFSSTSDFGLFIKEIEKGYTGKEYVAINEEDVANYISTFEPFNNLLHAFVENQFFSYNPYGEGTVWVQDGHGGWITKEENDANHAVPAIGMTAEEVINGAWGEPDKKNVTEISGLKHEQWIYEDQETYVYVENGVVVSIQYTEY